MSPTASHKQDGGTIDVLGTVDSTYTTGDLIVTNLTGRRKLPSAISVVLCVFVVFCISIADKVTFCYRSSAT